MPFLHGAQTGQRFHQLGLAVALYAGDAQDLARTHVQADAVDRHLQAIVQYLQVLDAEHVLVRMGRRLVHDQGHLAAHHHLGQHGLAGALQSWSRPPPVRGA